MRAFIFDLQLFATGVSLNNMNNDTLITGTAGNDSINNAGMNVSINAGDGDDSI